MEFDQKDKKILQILKESSNLTTSRIAKKTSIPVTTVHNRIRKLSKEGVIKNYTVNIDYEKIGKPLKAFVLVTVNQSKISQSKIGQEIKSIEGVESADIVTGPFDMIVEIRAKDMHILNDLITNKIRKIEGIDKTQTLMVLEEIE
jgi:Lrp/AsnC family transcriptional regulator for asnA, asnC and gidA